MNDASIKSSSKMPSNIMTVGEMLRLVVTFMKNLQIPNSLQNFNLKKAFVIKSHYHLHVSGENILSHVPDKA